MAELISGIIHKIRTAPDRSGSNQAITLTKEGATTWNNIVTPALEEALPRAYSTGPLYPYFDLLPESLKTGLEPLPYNEGVRDAVIDHDKFVIKPTALAAQRLSTAFGVERFASLTTETQQQGVVTPEIQQQKLNTRLAELGIDAQHTGSYLAGIATGAVKLALIEQENEQRSW